MHFGTDAVRGVKDLSKRTKRKTALLFDDDEQHVIVFKQGIPAYIACPKTPPDGDDTARLINADSFSPSDL